MIQIVKKASVAVPIVLQKKGQEATAALIARYENGERNFISKTDFDSKIYAHDDVKSSLLNVQSHKCCFCESKISHTSYGDVEHYRPKSAWVQNEEQLNKPGYFWLSYDWNNLFLACELCNQRHKKNYFPLRTLESRATSHLHDINTEDPLFIHPVVDNPEEFITFRNEMPMAIDGNERGTATIERLRLDRDKLNDQRRSVIRPIKDLYRVAKKCPDTNIELKQYVKALVNKYYEESQRDDTEYAAMKRAFFRQHPVSDL